MLADQPDLAKGIIDLAHLAHMTCGEKSLETEVLSLFDGQAKMLLARIEEAPARAIGALAHTLAGSARGIGAWEVAAAAERLEFAARQSAPANLADARRRLACAIARVQTTIRSLLAQR
jgi:HPt (histidine-containing phosphotransfer) domain-containing protein